MTTPSTRDKLANSQMATSNKTKSTKLPNQSTISCGYSKCDQIQIESSMFKLCSRCEKIYYCCKACQTSHWPEHKGSCKRASSTTATSASEQHWSASEQHWLSTIINSNKVSIMQFFYYILTKNLEQMKIALRLGYEVNAFGVSNTPLMYACSLGHVDCVELLLQSGVNVNLADDTNCTALYRACQKGCDKCVLLLLQNGADVGNHNCTALLAASRQGHDKCVDLLLQHGADVNAVNDCNCTSLFISSQEGHDKCVELLLKYKADVNRTCEFDSTPLLAESTVGHLKCAALLLLNGADVNIKDIDDRTPVYVACVQGSSNCVSLLISHGADIDTPCCEGNTPLLLARALNFDKCVSLLLENGANDKPTDHVDMDSHAKTATQDAQKACRVKRHEARHCDFPDCTNTECTVEEYQRCSRCKAVYYCGAVHQKLHWKKHKQLCHAIVKE